MIRVGTIVEVVDDWRVKCHGMVGVVTRLWDDGVRATVAWSFYHNNPTEPYYPDVIKIEHLIV